MSKSKPTRTFWMVFYGVDATHLTEHGGVFDRIKDARAAYDALRLEHPNTVKVLQRITNNPYSIQTLRCELS